MEQGAALSAPALRRGSPAPPVRLVHLGLGTFFRAHQAWYTDRATDAEEWGIAAFTGRRHALADALAAQDGLYTLITRAPGGDEFRVIRSLSQPHAAAEHEAWLGYIASPEVRVVTLTITEAGYRRNATGRLDLDAPAVAADVAALIDNPRAAVETAPARLVGGLLARRRAEAGPLTLVPCDNLPDNGRILDAVLGDLVDAVDPTLNDWLDTQVSTATTMVDRITPAPTEADRRDVLANTGFDDRSPVATEPFSEWVLCGVFPGGRPSWERAGAVLTGDIAPYENRKLWLLNGAHSLLAYVGSLRGSVTVAEAVRDEYCAGLLEEWWVNCRRHLPAATEELSAYCTALTERFANARMQHALAQIASDGSQKLPVRILPVLRRERVAGRLPEPVVAVLAAWLLHLRGAGAPIKDVRATELQPLASGPLPRAVPRLLGALDPALPDDPELVSAVTARSRDLSLRN